MKIKLEYSFGDWRDWFLIERKGFVIKSPFLLCEFLFARKDESPYRMKLKIPLLTKEMHIMCDCDEDLPESFRVTCLATAVETNLNTAKKHLLDFTKVEKVQKTFCSTHNVNVSDEVMSDCRDENYVRKFRFNKGVVGYSVK